MIKRKKENEEKQKKYAEEKQKVQNVCKDWLEEAYEEVYSLGVGDRIVDMSSGKAGLVFTIQNVEKNTFLVVNLLKDYVYVQKSKYIPYDSIKSAPSPYCYH